MTNENYKKLREELNNPYELLKIYANSERNITSDDFDKAFPTWCNMVSNGFPLQISMNMIIGYLDDLHAYVN